MNPYEMADLLEAFSIHRDAGTLAKFRAYLRRICPDASEELIDETMTTLEAQYHKRPRVIQWDVATLFPSPGLINRSGTIH